MIVVVMALVVVMIVAFMAFMVAVVVAFVVVMIVMVMALMIAVVVAFVGIVGMVLVIALGMGHTPARRGREVDLRAPGCRGQHRWREQGREYPSHRFRTWSESPQVWSTSSHTLAIDKQIPKGRKAARDHLRPGYEVNLQLNFDAQRGTLSAGG